MKRNLIKEYNYFFCGAISWILTLLSGYIAMYLMWGLMKPSDDLPGLFYYKAAIYGDSIGLTFLVGSLVALIKNNKGINITDGKKCRKVAGICGFIGMVIQAEWLISDSTVLDWTIPQQHYFNLAGWYHSIFFICMFITIGYLIAKVKLILRNKDSYTIREKLLIEVMIASVTLYMLCHISDNYPKIMSMGLSYVIVSIIIIIYMSFLLMNKDIRFSNIKGIIINGLIFGIGLYLIIVEKTVGNFVVSLAVAMSMIIYCNIEKINYIQYLMSCIPIIIGTFGIFYFISGYCDSTNKLGLSIIFIIFLLMFDFNIWKGKNLNAIGIVISIYVILISLFGKRYFYDYISDFFTIIMVLFFSKGIKNVFKQVVETEVDKNSKKISDKEFLNNKIILYIKITALIISLISILCDWIKFDIADFYFNKNILRNLFIGIILMLLIGEKIIKNIFGILLTILILICEYIGILIICYNNIIRLNISDISIISMCIIAFAIFANVGGGMLLSHGFRMNVAILRMKNITWQIYAISSIMGTGASLVSFSTTVLLAFDLSIKRLVISLCLIIWTYWVIPMVYVIIFRMNKEIKTSKIIPNTALGGVAQDGMMIVLVIFCASYLPNMFCTSMLYEGKRVEGIILLGIFLLITALDPVKFCLENNRNHLIRQRKVVKNIEMMGEWKILRHEIMIQSRQTCIAMFPYILIIIFCMIGKSYKNDSFVNVRQELKVFKRKYIETDDYDEEKIEKIFIQ